MYIIMNMKDKSIFTGITPTGRYKLESFDLKTDKTIVLCPIFLEKKTAEETMLEVSHHFIGAYLKVLSFSEVENLFSGVTNE